MSSGPETPERQPTPRRHEHTKQLSTALALAHMLARQIIKQREPSAMAQLVVDELIETFSYDQAAFLFFDEKRNVLRVEAEAGRMCRTLPGPGFEMQPRAGMIGNALRNGRSYLSTDTSRNLYFMWPAPGAHPWRARPDVL